MSDINITVTPSNSVSVSAGVGTTSSISAGSLAIHADSHLSGGRDAINHNNLYGLQGGSSSERYHLTKEQYDSLGGDGSFDFVSLTGNQTISGEKTFLYGITTPYISLSSDEEYGNAKFGFSNLSGESIDLVIPDSLVLNDSLFNTVSLPRYSGELLTDYSIIDSGTLTIGALPSSPYDSEAAIATTNLYVNDALNFKYSMVYSGGSVLSGYNLYDLHEKAYNANAAALNNTNSLNSLGSSVVYLTQDQTISGVKTFVDRPFVNGTGVMLSGEAAPLPTTIVYQTGNQIVSGEKSFINNTFFSGNVGVNQSSPQNKFEVSGKSYLGTFKNRTVLAGNQDTTVTSYTQSSSNNYALFSTIEVEPTANNSALYYSTYANAILNGTGNISRLVAFQGQTTHFSPSTITQARGMAAVVQNSAGGTITNAYGSLSAILNTSTGTITNAFATYAQNVANTGPITNKAGIVVDNVTNGTNNSNLLIGTSTVPSGNYSVYNSSSYNNFFSGSMGVGATSPAAKLDIADTWNNSGIEFTGVKLNITDTASSASSLLMDLQVGGSSKFKLDKFGTILLGGTNSAAGAYNNSINQNFITLGANIGGGSLIQLYEGTGRSTILGYGFGLRVKGDYPIAWGNNSDAGTNLDLYLYKDTANTLAQRNGTNAQTFRLYNTYTDASNYERGFLRWNTNVLEIGTEKLGTGTARNLNFQTDGTSRWTIDTSGRLVAQGQYGVFSMWQGGFNVTIGGTNTIARFYGDSGHTRISSSETSLCLEIPRLTFNGTTSSFPALKRVGTTIAVRLADDSADAALSCSSVTASGNITITGHLSAATKSFKIPHQTKSGYLQYGVVESNEHSVYVRGESSKDTITLPDHWEWLVDENSITVQLTSVGKFMPLYIIDKNNKTITVGGVEGTYNYTIYGTRKDVPDLIVETEE